MKKIYIVNLNFSSINMMKLCTMPGVQKSGLISSKKYFKHLLTFSHVSLLYP